ncbi:MAG: UDP-N-acetylmuramate:L-alanyl-gamma-D-glutamyl-meso-diaminopimelate ligase [Verrucomicrobia bacterium]|nr:MAG: UDP-N-acetylmuramate:L-alanyl-gamma-D-glutamyl-meso-diaminopimelate ligase [Verrucomicrobiota bacterium]
MTERGFRVTGSDEKVYPPISAFLQSKGIALKEGFRAENIPDDVDVVVIGNAMKRGNPEVEAVLNRKLFYLSLPEVLKNYFLRGRHNLVVTGTHGKTTTTALLTWIMEKAGRKPGYLIGGIPKNLGQGARLNDSKYFVIEGDEYDTAFFDKRSKFVHYLPELVIVNNIEFDHADIFRDLEDVNDTNCVEVAKDCRAQMLEVGFSNNCAQRIRDVAYSTTSSRFKLGDDTYEIPLVGEFNVRNAAMAVTAARFYDAPKAKIDNALKTFTGTARRQEVRGEMRGVTVIDDFGHHPTAVAKTLEALRHRFPGHRLWAIFEPRSNTTRRAVFQKQLPDALKLADGVVVAQVARLEQIPEEDRLNPTAVVQEIAERISPMLQAKDVVVVFSNGGFDNIHEKLLDKLKG